MFITYNPTDHHKYLINDILEILLHHKVEIIINQSSEEFKTLLANIFKKYNVEIIISKQRKISQKNLCLIGEFDPFLVNNIRIHLAINPKDDVIQINKLGFSTFQNYFTQTLVHELIHRYQYKKRNINSNSKIFKSEEKNIRVKEEQEYLGDNDEIEAYACDIYFELRNTNSLEKLRYINIQKKDSLSLWLYYQKFRGGSNNIVIKTLLKKIYKYIEE